MFVGVVDVMVTAVLNAAAFAVSAGDVGARTGVRFFLSEDAPDVTATPGGVMGVFGFRVRGCVRIRTGLSIAP